MRKLPNDTIQQAVKLHYKGSDALTIAAKVGVCLTTVYRIINGLQVVAVTRNEPRVCSHFSCAHHLTLTEQLYGGRCVRHQETIKLTHVINQVI